MLYFVPVGSNFKNLNVIILSAKIKKLKSVG